MQLSEAVPYDRDAGFVMLKRPRESDPLA